MKKITLENSGLKIIADARSYVNKIYCHAGCFWSGRPIELTHDMYCPACGSSDLEGGHIEPMKEMDECFEVQNISWSVIIPVYQAKAVRGQGIVKGWVDTEMAFTSGLVERGLRKKHHNYD